MWIVLFGLLALISSVALCISFWPRRRDQLSYDVAEMSSITAAEDIREVLRWGSTVAHWQRRCDASMKASQARRAKR